MRSRPTFALSLRFLSHPLTLLALVLLPFNDFLLRRLWPGWWTGKLGDAAWLFIAPGALALLLSALTARSATRLRGLPGATSRTTAVLAYLMTGLGFALFKTHPGFHAAILNIWQALLGFPARALLDPTDLLALAALPLSAALYFRPPALSARAQQSGAIQTAGWQANAWLVIPVLALFTLADSAMPDSGIACLAEVDGVVQSTANYAAFVSSDGGLTWSSSPTSAEKPCPYYGVPAPLTVDLPDGRQLRAIPGQRIEISADSGQTWQLEYTLTGLNEVMKAYYQKTGAGNVYFTDGPQAALVDEAAGSVIFAMGHRGVLVRRGAGSAAGPVYTWAAVGQYRNADLATQDAFVTVLGGEVLLTFALALLQLGTCGLAVRRQSRRLAYWLLAALGVLAWLAWAAGVTIFPPAISAGYSGSFSTFTNLGGLVLSVPFAVLGTVFLVRARVWHLLPFGLSGTLFLLPYIFWYTGALPAFTTARTASLVLALACGACAVFLGVRSRPQPAQPTLPASPPAPPEPPLAGG